MPLSKHTNTIQLTVEFTNREAAGNLTRYSSYLIGENARYKWNYTIPPHTPVYYKPYSTTWQSGGTTLVDHHKTMRLHADGNLKLHLEFESNGILHTQILDIPSILAKVEKNGVYLYDTNEKLEMHDYFEIKIQIGEGYVIATLIVDEWFLVIAGEDM